MQISKALSKKIEEARPQMSNAELQQFEERESEDLASDRALEVDLL